MDIVYHQTVWIWALGQDKTPWASLESLEGDSHERERKKKQKGVLGQKSTLTHVRVGEGRSYWFFFFFFFLHVFGSR